MKQRKPIYQLRVSLCDMEPEIWRRMLISGNLSLAKVHEVIQIVMGWENCHLHEFRLADGRCFAPRDFDLGAEVGDVKKHTLRKLLPESGADFSYRYDFGDDWLHRVEVEAIVSPVDAGRVPRCIDGARACPPEDVGGGHGYALYLEALGDPRHPNHEELLQWRGRFEAEAFELPAVNRALRSTFPRG